MKRKYELILCKLLVACMTIPFFVMNSLPVYAESDYNYTPIPYWSLGAYQYWGNVGFQHTWVVNWSDTVTESTTGTISASDTRIYLGGAAGSGYAGSVNGTIGHTGQAIICSPSVYTSPGQASNVNYSCQYHGNTSTSSTNYGTSQYINFNTVNISGYMDEDPRTVSMTTKFTQTGKDVYGYTAIWSQNTNYSHDTEYNFNHSFQLYANSSVYLAFVTDTSIWNNTPYTSPANSAGNRYMKIYSRDEIDTKVTRLSQVNVTGMYKIAFKIENLTNTTTQINLDFPKMSGNVRVIPYYLGDGSDAPAEVLEAMGVDTKTVTLLREGDDNSKAAENNLKNQNTTLENTVNQINSMETEFNDDMTDALNDIDISTDLVQHTGFTNAALWVASQFNRFVIGTPFELVLTFSLVTGLGLILLGRIRS